MRITHLKISPSDLFELKLPVASCNPDLGVEEGKGLGTRLAAEMNRVEKILRSPAGFASCAALFLLFLAFDLSCASLEPRLGSARVVFQTNYGDIEFGFFHEIAPKTVDHIFKLVRLGCYNTNHFFRVDKGFVAQVADISQGRSAPMNEEQKFEAQKTVVGEFSKVKHVRGTLSMGRYS
ncbi:hypothetical protein KSP40_PGU001465 [Platanthera guangdongensis]|uniref:PPIase cyclophilin-type domain-containing protein n=1 Tax=Platanthera guangdongensis TaxID=2320717 RepID=A0ABR2N2T7_9ASPA